MTKDKEFLEYLEKGGKPREIDFIPDEILEQEIKFEEEPKREYKIKTPPIKLNMNRVLDLIMAHYRYVTTGSDAEWDRQLVGFVNAIPDEQIREHFKKQITFFGDQEKLLFYGWGQEI